MDFPLSGTEPQASSASLVDLSDAEAFEDFDWHPDDDDVVYFSNLETDPMTTLPVDFLQSPLPDGLGFSTDCGVKLGMNLLAIRLLILFSV